MLKNLSYAMTLFYVVAGFLFVLFGAEPIRAQTFTPEHVSKRSERIYTPLSFEKDGKTIALQVEVANTDDLRALGLMYRTKMPDNEGMLFDFEESRPVYMWMQNTFVALDMIFLTEQGQVHHIVKQTTPLSRSLIGSGGAVRFVLEVKAGLVERYQLKKGDQIAHELFTNK